MNVDNEVKRIGGEIRQRVEFIRWLRRNRQKLEAVPEGATFWNGRLDLNTPKHEETVKLIRAVGGKFKKEPGCNPHSIDYTGELDGIPVKAWCGEPPPSCRIVEVEELVPETLIPAHIVKRKKMVCSPELPAQIAIARDAAKADAVSPVVQPLK